MNLQSLGHHENTSCSTYRNVTDENLIRAVLTYEVTDGSGGGGGATYVFLVKHN